MDKRLRRELESHRTSLEQAGESGLDGLIEDALRWATDALDLCDTEIKKLRTEFQQIHDQWFKKLASNSDSGDGTRADYYQTKAFFGALVGGWAVSLLEVLFTTGTAQFFLNSSREVAWVVGFLVATFIAAANKGFFTPIATAKLQETPKASRDKLLKRLAVVTVPELALLYLLLAIARGTASLDKYLGLVMGALSILTPVIAGLLFALATLLGWSRDLAKKTRGWNDLMRSIHGLEDKAAYMASERDPDSQAETLRKQLLLHVHRRQARESEPLGPRDLARSEGKNVVPSLIFMFLLASFGSKTPLAQASMATAQPKHVLVPVRGEIWDDGTGSVDTTDLAAAHHAVLSTLRGISFDNQINEWRFYKFADSAWKESAAYTLPIPTFTEPKCDPAEKNEASTLFKRDHSAADETCVKLRKDTKDAYDVGIQKAIETFGKFWRATERREGHCTSIHDVLERLSRESGVVRAIIITDGLETCLKDWPAVPTPHDDIRVVVLLVSSLDSKKGGSLAVDFDHRKSALLEKAPWLVILPPWQFDGGSFSNRSGHVSLAPVSPDRASF